MNADLGLSLKNKNILVTGVSRSMGIGAAIAKTLAEAGANVVTHGCSGYDKALQYPDASVNYTNDLVNELSDKGYRIYSLPSSDLSEKDAPEKMLLSDYASKQLRRLPLKTSE